MKRLSMKQEARIMESYAETSSCSKTGDQLGVSASSVCRVLVRNGVPRVGHDGPYWRMGDRHKLTDEEETEIATRYASGERSSILAKQFSCTVGLVREVVRRNGGVVGPRGNRYREFSEAEVEEMARRWRDGESQTTIAVNLGVAQVIVSRVLRGAGHQLETRRAVGPAHGKWKGGRVQVEAGYWQVKVDSNDPLASMRNRIGYILEHRLVMARHLGRPLLRTETVHHINGDHADNRLENLQLRQGKHGKGTVLRCNDCGSTNVGTHALADTED